ncbi:putative adenylate kinase 7, mitochondrial [Drosera capensis]
MERKNERVQLSLTLNKTNLSCSMCIHYVSDYRWGKSSLFTVGEAVVYRSESLYNILDWLPSEVLSMVSFLEQYDDTEVVAFWACLDLHCLFLLEFFLILVSLFYSRQIANAINQGKLVPENIIFGLLLNRLEEGYDRGETGFILEGIPRTRVQAEILDQLADIDLVVNFKCCEGRIQGDRTCSDGCTPSHATKNPTTIGSKLSQDSSKPKVSAFYAEQRKLLEDYYRSQKKLIDFQVGSAFRDAWKGLLAVLHLPHFDVNHIARTLGTESSKP